jgi:hypothetical protein
MNSKRITIPVSVMQSFREGDFNPPYREKFDHAATLKEPKITVNEDEAARILECLAEPVFARHGTRTRAQANRVYPPASFP